MDHLREKLLKTKLLRQRQARLEEAGTLKAKGDPRPAAVLTGEAIKDRNTGQVIRVTS